jgi:hypothetical protein
MIDKNEAPFGFYAIKGIDGLYCANCELPQYFPCSNCFRFERRDKTFVNFKARWWYRPVLVIRKLMLRRK